MGCDIHAFIESRSSFSGSGLFRVKAQLEIPRNYEIFNLMAGVRGPNDPLFPLKGIPEDSCSTIKMSFGNRIVDTEEEAKFDGTILRLEAKITIDRVKLSRIDNDYILKSGLHSPSWLSTQEFRKVIKSYNRTDFTIINAIYMFMKHLKEEARIVFCFDN